MTLKTSLIITGDSSVAKKAVDELNASVATLTAGAKSAATPIAQLDQAQAGAAESARRGVVAAGQLGEAQLKAAGGATAHAAAAEGLQGEIRTMLAQIAGGSSVFQTMADRGGAFAAALGQVALASNGAKAGIKATGDSGGKASVHLENLGSTVHDVAGKAAGMGDTFASAAAMMAGPFGAAAGIAIDVVASLVVELIASKSALDQEMDALKENAVKTNLARQAKEAFGKTQAGIMFDVRNLTDEINKQNEALRTNAERQNIRARQSVDQLTANRADLVKQLEDARAALSAVERGAPASFGGAESRTYASQLATAKSAVAALQGQLKSLDADFAEAQQALQRSHLSQAQESAKSYGDAIAAINRKYDAEELRLTQLKNKEIALGKAVGAQTQRQFDDIERRRKADIAAEEERQRLAAAKPKTVSIGNQIEAGSAASMLATAERYKGLSENRAGDRAQLRDLFAQANVNVDPTMVAWCAAFVNSVLAANGVKGTGSLSARSFLGFGQATDKPNKGDIVVSKRGDDASRGHVGFYQGTDAKGRVLVLGGNTGDRVATEAIARQDVLGFRRAPSAADAYKDSLKAAEEARKAAADAAKEQERNLDQVIAKYLPATAAAKDYADELARINALAKSYDGKNATSGLTPEQADAARAALKAANDKRMAEINMTPEAKAANDAKKSIDGVIASLTKELAVRQTLDPVQRAMAEHQDELAKMSDEERKAYEAKLTSLYAQREAYTAVEEATRAAADAQRQLRDMALDAFDAIVLGGEKAGDVFKRLLKTIASAAVEAAVLGTGPLAALLKGGTAAPAATAASGTATQAAADLVGKSVGKSLDGWLDTAFGKGRGGKVLQNAGFGFTAASITGGSGIGGSVGGAIGGELAGKFLTTALGSLGKFAGPLGAIAGGILGGVVGKLFTGSQKASASISAENGAFVASKGTGSTGALASQAGGLAGSVASGLQQIAEQLGGGVGSISGLSIGTKNGKVHVNSVGGQIGVKGSGDVGFGKDGAEDAVAYAIQQAITKGAVTGLSNAVQQAIRSSTDINKALAEALKVQDLELLVGGVNAQIDKAFRDFETQAKERVRLATTYGFDVVAIEKRNGEDRAKLAAKLATDQVGSLQKLIEEMTQGSLFEGTAMDRIAALNTAIAKAKADLDANVDGAADTLADLYQKRLVADKDAYGTTGAYAADRAATLDDARAAVAAANARIVAAQAAKPTSDPALVTTNATLDEIAAQNARVVSTLNITNELIAQLSGGGTSSNIDLLKMARV